VDDHSAQMLPASMSSSTISKIWHLLCFYNLYIQVMHFTSDQNRHISEHDVHPLDLGAARDARSR
jgi:hypothetical protein